MNKFIFSSRRNATDRHPQRHGWFSRLGGCDHAPVGSIKKLLRVWRVSLNQLLLASLVLGYWRFKSGERSPQQSGSTPFTSMISQFGEKIQTLSKKLHAASECFTSLQPG